MPFTLYYVSAYLICLSWRNCEGDLNLTFGHSLNASLLYVENLGIIVIFIPYSKPEYLKFLSHGKLHLVCFNLISGKY